MIKETQEDLDKAIGVAAKILAEHYSENSEASIVGIVLAGEILMNMHEDFRSYNLQCASPLLTFIYRRISRTTPEGVSVDTASVIQEFLDHGRKLLAVERSQSRPVDVVAQEIAVTPPPSAHAVDLSHAVAELNAITDKVHAFGSQLSGIKQP